MRRAGQVLIETALAAIGLIVLAFMIVRIGLWLNAGYVTRNDNFQDTRVAAGSAGAGVVPFAAPPPIHLIGPAADFAGAAGAQPPGPSAAPASCTGAGDLLLDEAEQARLAITQLSDDANDKSTEFRDESNRAADLINGNMSGHTARFPCSGDQCKSANWYWQQAAELDRILADIATWEGNRRAAVTDKATAEAISCPACTTTTTRVCDPDDCSDNTSCKNDVRTFCRAAWPPGPDRTRCALVGINDCNINRPCVAGACHDETTSDCSAHDTCETNKTNDINAAQNRINTADSNLTRLRNEQALLCAAVRTGNPWVPGAAPLCDPDDLRAYAQRVAWEAGVRNTRAQTLADQVENLALQIQMKIAFAQDKEREGRAACSSGRDP